METLGETHCRTVSDKTGSGSVNSSAKTIENRIRNFHEFHFGCPACALLDRISKASDDIVVCRQLAEDLPLHRTHKTSQQSWPVAPNPQAAAIFVFVVFAAQAVAFSVRLTQDSTTDYVLIGDIRTAQAVKAALVLLLAPSGLHLCIPLHFPSFRFVWPVSLDGCWLLGTAHSHC